ncbi:hypothetical protein ACH5RR_010369 [Cinchona calisaya]|uniref:Uncharacterized protein n=1 Tax=Cinchona calisaya TaxID=153742 RepID=A0ABD3AIQ9_9GENT
MKTPSHYCVPFSHQSNILGICLKKQNPNINRFSNPIMYLISNKLLLYIYITKKQQEERVEESAFDFVFVFILLLIQMGAAAELQTGKDDQHHNMSISNIWFNIRKRAGGVDNKASENGGGGDASKKKKQLCVCAPTTHAGSFRCRLHRTTTAHSPLPSLPRLSKSVRAVGTATATASQPIPTPLQRNQQFSETHQDAAEPSILSGTTIPAPNQPY